MPYVTQPEVQAWLEPTKLTLDSVDAELEANAAVVVFTQLAQVYDTSTWVNAASTPELVRKIMAMLIAAWTYARAYSQDDIAVSEGFMRWLERKAHMLIEGLVSGAIDLVDVPGIAFPQYPTFWPNDSTEVEDPNSAAAFAMGRVY